jgi:hypothetical protein
MPDTYRVEYESGRTAEVRAESADDAIRRGRYWHHVAPPSASSRGMGTSHYDTSEPWAVYSLTEYPDPTP